jgi:hypothetical protein
VTFAGKYAANFRPVVWSPGWLRALPFYSAKIEEKKSKQKQTQEKANKQINLQKNCFAPCFQVFSAVQWNDPEGRGLVKYMDHRWIGNRGLVPLIKAPICARDWPNNSSSTVLKEKSKTDMIQNQYPSFRIQV